MRIARLSYCLVAVLALVPATIGMARADPLTSTDDEPILRDPAPSDSHSFPPGLATDGAADPSHALSAAPASSRAGCGPLNPCAVPTPAQNHVDAPKPAPP